MTPQAIHDLLLERFGPEGITHFESDAIDPWVIVPSDRIVEVCLFLRDHADLDFKHLNDLTVVDYFESNEKKRAKFGHEPHLEVVYHLSSLTHGHRFVLKVELPRWRDGIEGQLPETASVWSVWAIAEWHEREAYDLCGVRFIGHPNLRRILCPEDWDGHPLRKDYAHPEEYHGIRNR